MSDTIYIGKYGDIVNMPTTSGYRLTICILQMTRLAQIGCNGATGHKLNTTLREVLRLSCKLSSDRTSVIDAVGDIFSAELLLILEEKRADAIFTCLIRDV